MLEPLNFTHKKKKTMALTAAFGVKRLTCVHRPMPSSVCRAGSTAARTQWHAGMRNSCVFDTPVKSTRRDKVKAVLQRNVWEFFFFLLFVSADLSDVYPALDDSGSDMRSDLFVFEHRADHTGCHGIELGDGGTDGRGAVLVFLLVPLRPDGAQAVVGHHLFKQQLQHQRKHKPSLA